MATELEKKQRTCADCGASVRDNTAFCYNCGTRVPEEPEPTVDVSPEPLPPVNDQTRSALDDLAKRLERDSKNEEKLTKAAKDRRRSRIAQRKPQPPRWEPDDGTPAIRLLLVTALVLVVALLVVYFTTISK